MTQRAADGRTAALVSRGRRQWRRPSRRRLRRSRDATSRQLNAAGRQLTRLNENRALASPWQEQAIDEITPLLPELAANTTAVIEHLDANKTRLHTAEYKEYLTANYEVSKELSALITDFVDYAKHTNKFEHLTNKLEIERK